MNYKASSEDYLERILMLTNRNGKVRSVDISNDIGYSKPSISIAMKKLKARGLILIDEKGYITLTESGMVIASKIYERHLVLSQTLISYGVPENIAVADACKVEHDLSDISFAAIKAHFYGSK